MILLCWLFGHRDGEPYIRVMPSFHGFEVHVMLTCKRCGSARTFLGGRRYTLCDYATFRQLKDYVNAEVSELERMAKL